MKTRTRSNTPAPEPAMLRDDLEAVTLALVRVAGHLRVLRLLVNDEMDAPVREQQDRNSHGHLLQLIDELMDPIDDGLAEATSGVVRATEQVEAERARAASSQEAA